MNAISPAILIPVAGLIAFTASLIVSGVQSVARANAAPPEQSGPSLAVDDCIEADQGDVIQLQIRVSDVSDLLAWEVYFAYDPNLLEVVDRDVRSFLSETQSSSVFDFSDPVPNRTGVYRMGAADVSLGDTAESGSGVLATVTLVAKARGVSPATIFRDDVNGDGITDFGPTLTAIGGQHISDDGNSIFDGPISSGQIAIDESCETTPPTPRLDDVIVVLPEVTRAPDQSPGTETPGASATPTVFPTAATPTSGDGTSGNGSPGGDPPDTDDGVAYWLIAVIPVIAAFAVASVLIIIRGARRTA